MTRLNGSRTGKPSPVGHDFNYLISSYPASVISFVSTRVCAPCLARQAEISKGEKNNLNKSKMLENRIDLSVYQSVEKMIASSSPDLPVLARFRFAPLHVTKLPNEVQRGKDFSRTKKDPCSSHAETTHKELARAKPLSVFHLPSSLNFFPSLSFFLLFITHARVLLRSALACCRVKRGKRGEKKQRRKKEEETKYERNATERKIKTFQRVNKK